MRTLLAKMLANKALMRKVWMLGILLGATVAAFCWGRLGAPQLNAQSAASNVVDIVGKSVTGTTTDYGKRVVATIKDNVYITREDLGEYLIARFGAERVEFL